MGFSLRASLSCDCAHLIPLLRMFLLPPMCILGNLPFFFIMMVIESNATLIAIINNVNNKVLNISIIFVGNKLCESNGIMTAKIQFLSALFVYSLCEKCKKECWKRVN